MSKNGSLLFKNFNPYITSGFGYRIHPITGDRRLHQGVDYGTDNQKLPTYGIDNGTVVGSGYQNAIGNYVYVNYPRLNHNAIYQHLDRISVQNGQSVDKDTVIGYVGSTGEVTGIHLHFGWFPTADQNKSWNERNWQDFEEYNYPEEVKYLGTPVLRDSKFDQIEVLIKNLHVRADANGEILGYINEGIYNILDKKVLADYTWYKLGEGMWIAYIENYTKIYLKEEIEKPNDKDENTEQVEEDTSPKEDSDNLETDENSNDTNENNEETQISTNKFIKFFQKVIEFIKKILKKFGIL